MRNAFPLDIKSLRKTLLKSCLMEPRVLRSAVLRCVCLWGCLLVSAITVWSYPTDIKEIKREDSIRRVKMTELFAADDREGFLKECDNLIQFHKQGQEEQKQGNKGTNGGDKYLFEAYTTKFDRLLLWGQYDNALQTLEQMSSAAQMLKSSIGDALTSLCFGHFYFGNNNPKEAESYFLTAFERLLELDQTRLAIKAAFHLQEIQINLGNLEKGLEFNDSTSALLRKMEEEEGLVNPMQRLQQLRYRLMLMLQMGNVEQAAQVKDTMLYYVAICQDSLQNKMVQSAIAQFEYLTGKKEAAYSRLEKLIKGYLATKDYKRAAYFRKTLAEQQHSAGDLDKAIENYRLYIIESDSAKTHENEAQINQLTRKHKLHELELRHHEMRRRLVAVSVIAVLLLFIVVASIAYRRSARVKNRILYRAALQNIEQQEKEDKKIIKSYSSDHSKEHKLYATLLSVMQSEELFKNPNLSRDILASRIGTNRTALDKIVKKCSGKTVAEFVNEFRLHQAVELLTKEKTLPIYAIGEEVGFSSRTTFHRCFIKFFGISPANYRKMAEEKKE